MGWFAYLEAGESALFLFSGGPWKVSGLPVVCQWFASGLPYILANDGKPLFTAQRARGSLFIYIYIEIIKWFAIHLTYMANHWQTTLRSEVERLGRGVFLV